MSTVSRLRRVEKLEAAGAHSLAPFLRFYEQMAGRLWVAAQTTLDHIKDQRNGMTRLERRAEGYAVEWSQAVLDAKREVSEKLEAASSRQILHKGVNHG